MLSAVLDVFRMRQYFDMITRLRELGEGVRDDVGLLSDVRQAFLPLPFEHRPAVQRIDFPGPTAPPAEGLSGRRVALIATGGSGALASVVGAARAFEEAGVTPSVISLCSGSALFGFPIAAGLSAAEVADFCVGLSPTAYVDVNWTGLAGIFLSQARGFAGLIRGDRLEETYRRLLGNRTLGDLPIPAYAPVWNVEHNRVEYIGPATQPGMPVARAVHMAVSLPLFIQPVGMGGDSWCDGGIVDIFPVRPVLDMEPRSDAAVAVNGFYPPRFEGEDATGWQSEAFSILRIASQVRTCQQVELARTNLRRLERSLPTVMIEPVPYEKVRGVGFYRQFLSTRDWPAFMTDGLIHTRSALRALSASPDGARSDPPRGPSSLLRTDR